MRKTKTANAKGLDNGTPINLQHTFEITDLESVNHNVVAVQYNVQ